MKKDLRGSYVAERIVEDENVITSQGPGTAMEFSLGILRKLEGKTAADKVAEKMLFEA